MYIDGTIGELYYQHWGHRPPLLLSFVSYLWFLVLVPARLRLRCHRNTRVRSGTGLLHSHQPFAVLPSALGVGGLTFFHRPFSVRQFGKNALPFSFKILRTKTCITILYWHEETPSANTHCIFDISTDVGTLKHFDLCFQESSYSLPIAFSSTKY